jgi:hypothetical protein
MLFTGLRAQEDFLGFVEPNFAVGYSLSPSFSQNASIRQRSFFFRDGDFGLVARQLDLVLFTRYKWSPGRSASFGIQYRFRDIFEPDSENEIRLTQQFDISYRPNIIRLGHRFRVEQRFFAFGTVHRLRYRIALDGPLQGSQTDVGEFYWIGSVEPVLNLTKGQSPVYNLRVTGWIGYQASPGLQIQFGPEYRRISVSEDSLDILLLLASCVLTL